MNRKINQREKAFVKTRIIANQTLFTSEEKKKIERSLETEDILHIIYKIACMDMLKYEKE